jgi:hypothetical protein
MIFNLSDIVAIKLIELPYDFMTQVDTIKYVLFFVDKKGLANSDEIVYSIGLETLEQFSDPVLLAKLENNTVAIRSLKSVCLRNLFLFISDDGNFKLDSNLYSSIDLIDMNNRNENDNYENADLSVDLSDEVFTRKVFAELRNDLAVKAYDLVNFSGVVINTCEEGFLYSLSCPQCGNQSNKPNQTLSQRFVLKTKFPV